jgi:GNAT superfamily N-acetyltransferase
MLAAAPLDVVSALLIVQKHPPFAIDENQTMSDTLTIRPVVREDFDRWLPLWLGYNAFYGRAGATALPEVVTQMTWSRFFDAYEPVHALVADSDGQLLGLTHYLFHRSTTAIHPNCYLQDLFTTSTSRGKGVGRALINGVYERAKAAGSPRVYWTTHETNSAGIELYDKVAERSGFVVYRKLL